MRRNRCRSLPVYVVLSGILLLLPSCNGNGKKIGELGAKVKVLEDRGIPDSILADAHLDLANVRNGDRTGVDIREYLDSLRVHVAVAETWSAAALQAARERIDLLMPDVTARKSGLSGGQLMVADSILTAAQSYLKRGWLLQAAQALDNLDSTLAGLLGDEQLARKAAAQIVGAWTYAGHEGNALHRMKISFLPDGSFAMSESMNGETAPDMKEEWEYQTTGDYRIRGDTVNLVVNREKLVRQTFWNRDSTNRWKMRQARPYDSAISSGLKNRSFSFEYIKTNFHR